MRSSFDFAEHVAATGAVSITDFCFRPRELDEGEVSLPNVWEKCDGQNETRNEVSCVPLYGNFRLLGVEESQQVSQDFADTVGDFAYQS